MEKDELIREGINGCRLKLTMALKSKPYDISMIILIILYTLLIFVYFAFVDFFTSEENQDIFYIVELTILGIFCLEIALHIIALGKLYLRDIWNSVDIIIIILSLVFVFLDMFVENQALQGFLKIRGIFRLLRIFLLIRKLNTLRLKREVKAKQSTIKGYDIRSPLERVLEILNSLRDNIDAGETTIIQ